MSADPGSEGETLIFTCAGAAHGGQVANRAGAQLAKEGVGKLFCTAAVAAVIPEKVKRTRDARLRIAIDGCEERCCHIVLEKAGIPAHVHVVVTDLGIEKEPAKPQMVTDTEKVAEHVKKVVVRRRP
jgi:uncharacterized metal-binding protein